jgi:hypothetical protein
MMKEFNKSRRKFIKLALGAIGLGGLASYGITTFNLENFIRSTLTSLLGDYNIAEMQMRKFCHDFIKSYGDKKLYVIIMRKQISVLEPVAERLFRVQAYWAYHGMKSIPCNNPFAQLEYVKH